MISVCTVVSSSDSSSPPVSVDFGVLNSNWPGVTIVTKPSTPWYSQTELAIKRLLRNDRTNN